MIFSGIIFLHIFTEIKTFYKKYFWYEFIQLITYQLFDSLTLIGIIVVRNNCSPQIFQMKINFLLFFFTAIFFWGCSQDQTTIQIVRNPTFSFNFSPTNTWVASNYSITDISKVVVYPHDTSQPAQLYDRYALQGSGKDDSGRTFQLVITFDLSNNSPLIGIYTPAYTSLRGLAQVQLYNLTNNNDLSVYNLCSQNLGSDVFQISKQKPDERIVTGSFQMTLCNSRDTTQILNITGGTVKDLKY